MMDMCESGCRAAHHDRQHGPDLGPKQMWNREALRDTGPIHEAAQVAAGARPLGCRNVRGGGVLEMVRVPCRFACLCSLKAALLPLHELALCGAGAFASRKPGSIRCKPRFPCAGWVSTE